MVVFKPPTVDQGVDTSEPDYERYLVVRIYTPEDLEEKDLKCSIIYGDQRLMTGILDADTDTALKSEKAPSKSQKSAPKK